MIRTNIKEKFPDQLPKCITTDSALYIADYTEQTKDKEQKRGIELIKDSPPRDIDYFFTVNNPCKLEMNGIPFDNNSFTTPNGSIASQCECVIFPNSSDDKSWILFLELKYSNKCKNNRKNLNKARKQLFKTQYYYKSKGVFNKNNICYLLASLPMQQPPFANYSLSQTYLLAMKRKHNMVIRFQNLVKIIDDKHIEV